MSGLRVAPNLSLPIDIAGQTIGIVGIRGSGKTNTATVLCEELLSQHYPVAVIDPTDAWYGLRSEYPVFIFGGSHGDIPLAEGDGKAIAEFIVTERAPVILSLRHLRKNAQRRFVTDFAEEIFHLKGKPENRSPLTVIIDEAPLFVPQKVLGEMARTVGAVEDLIARGRNAGFGVILISQRPATINKDVLTQADTIITHRLTSPQDRKALGEWIEENASIERHKEVLSSLASMPNGEAWVWSPRIDVFSKHHIRKRKTFDSSFTPKMGESVKAIKSLKDIDLGKLKEKLAAAVEAKEANDPAALKKKIAKLEKEIAARPTTTAAPVNDRAAGKKIDQLTKLLDVAMKFIVEITTRNFDPSVPKDDILKAIEAAVNTATSKMETSWLTKSKEFGSLKKQAGALLAKMSEILEKDIPIAVEVVHNKPFSVSPARRTIPVASRGSGSGDSTLSKCEKAILNVLAQRNRPSSKNQIAILSGYSVSSGSFNNSLSSLRTKDFISGFGDQITVTDSGINAVGDFDELPSGEALHQYWMNKLSKCEAEILRVLIDNRGDAISKEEIANQTESKYSSTSGSYNNSLSKLRTLELIEGYKEIKASESLFE